jgi:ring-1,2-phenylacetyl-CoA epoxidase subunit PaaE
VTAVLDGVTRTFTLEKGKESILEAGTQGRSRASLFVQERGVLDLSCEARLQARSTWTSISRSRITKVARGFVLTCQSHPVTDRVTVDYDQTG